MKEYLEMEVSRLKLDQFIGQVLIPTEKVFQIRNGKKSFKREGLPSWLCFIRSSFSWRGSSLSKSTPHVIGFLGAKKGGDPVPMRLTEVNRILGKVDELAENEEEMKIPFVLGESVKVIDGPFNNFSGVIDDINEEKKKLKVMVKIFGRKNLLELSYMQVEKEI